MSREFDIGEQKAFRPAPRSFTEIDRDEIVRQTLDEVARRLGALGGNATYRRAFEISANLARAMKP
jgi:hypothetical protein